MNTTIYSDENKLDRGNFLKFHCRLESFDGRDAPRDFTGCYYPRYRSFYIDEVRLVLGEVRVFPAFPLEVYTAPDGEYFYTADFEVGKSIVLGRTCNMRDKGVKRFTITKIDCSRLRCTTDAGSVRQHSAARRLPQHVTENLAKIRDGFIHMASDDSVLGIKDIGRRFRVCNDDGDRVVSLPELKKAVKEAKVELSDTDLREIFDAFDKNSDGTISYDDLVREIRGPMSEARRQIIRKAFCRLDHHNDGVITIKDIAAKYRTTRHPEVLAGRLTQAQVLQSFLSIWDNHDRNGEVTYAEFTDYYNGISASIEDDELFCAVVSAAWSL